MIEAMAGGAPVACSDIPVFREIAGEAAEFFDPQNVEDMASVMLRVLADPDRRGQLSQRGRSHARGFTWERAAQQTRAVLEKVASAG